MDFASALLLDERGIAPVLEEPYFAVKLVSVVTPAMLPPRKMPWNEVVASAGWEVPDFSV